MIFIQMKGFERGGGKTVHRQSRIKHSQPMKLLYHKLSNGIDELNGKFKCFF